MFSDVQSSNNFNQVFRNTDKNLNFVLIQAMKIVSQPTDFHIENIFVGVNLSIT